MKKSRLLFTLESNSFSIVSSIQICRTFPANTSATVSVRLGCDVASAASASENIGWKISRSTSARFYTMMNWLRAKFFPLFQKT